MAATGGEFPDVLDMHGLAAVLKVSHEWVRTRVKRREIPFTRLGKRMVRFTPEHVDAILAAGDQPALNGPLAARPTGPQAVPDLPPTRPVDIRRSRASARPSTPVDVRRKAGAA
ncbi:helix-turn-helix domain-containing protein [Micromonospora sp. NPDC048930]|uniref:helix-turn-helix domain-containing protein n=1 Tax=Micromonospora sp. NPDC048930 TaxID=3364261 RepID=UPI003713C3EC